MWYFLFDVFSGDKAATQTIPTTTTKKMRDFIGIDVINDETKANLMNFSYYLTIGDLDEAYRSVQNIKSASVWESMARMCVKTKRLDVAQVCFANMANNKGSSSHATRHLLGYDLNDEQSEISDDIELAFLAIDLGMFNEAQSLFENCERYDLVIELLQALGKWEQSIKFCEKYDRVHLKVAYFKYGEYLLQSGNTQSAINAFSKSDNLCRVAESLFEKQDFRMLESLVEVCNQ